MFFKKRDSAKVTNGFYIRHPQYSDLKIGQQNLEADAVYIYRYNPETGRHEGQWVRRVQPAFEEALYDYLGLPAACGSSPRQSNKI